MHRVTHSRRSLTWKLAARDETGAVFVARSDVGELGPATWALDPAFPAPDSTTTELRILVWERACSSGSAATGRMSAAVVLYGPAAVTITLGVRPLGGMQTCPGSPGTPAILRLREPLGDRTLFDGGRVPPAAPEPA